MAKYIIEFENEPSMVEAGLRYYQCKQVPYWGVSHGIIKNLTPYTEPDRKAIEDEVWENTWKMFMTPEDFGATMGDSYSEAKAKYDAWKEQKEEIHVGDEVEIAGTTAVVVRVPEGDEKRVHYISPSGTVYCNNGYADIVKTGRHFSEVEKLLERMREE